LNTVHIERKNKMKVRRLLALLLVLALCAWSQSAPSLNNTFGTESPFTTLGAISAGPCDGQANVGSIYHQSEDPANGFSGAFICTQSGPRTGNSGGFGWAAILISPPGTTGTRGPTILYNSFCGSTAGNGTCANMTNGATVHLIGGIATLSSNSAVISGISPAFVSTSTMECWGQDITTRANPVQVISTSTSSVTITNTTGASDVVNWSCLGY
jgi:hypothetical protein